MRLGDVSRQRRFADPARQRWYAYYRAVRFANRMLRAETVVPGSAPGTAKATARP